MFAVSSGQVRAAAGGILEAPSAVPVQRRSVAAVVGHGLVIGTAATVLQILILLALLYGAGILGS
jgi:hypothetical protein